MVYGGLDAGGTMPGSTSQIDVCDIVVDDATNSVIFGDGSFLADTTSGSTYGCMSTTYHQHVVNVSAYTDSITMTYHLADDCWQAPGEPCDDQFGEVVVPAPSDEPLCFPDDFEPNDFFESPDTWTPFPQYEWQTEWTANVGICPGDVDIYVHKELAYGGWVHVEIIDFESTGEMEVTLWDLGISEYALDYVTSDLSLIHI